MWFKSLLFFEIHFLIHLICFPVKPELKGKTETFYGMKEGESNNVRIKFTANPKPSAGVWTLGEKTVPVGASDNENTATSSQITESGVSIIFLLFIQFWNFLVKA